MITNLQALPTSAGVFAASAPRARAAVIDFGSMSVRHHRVAVLDEMPHHRLAHPPGADDADFSLSAMVRAFSRCAAAC
jgi:hypothetical protein